MEREAGFRGQPDLAGFDQRPDPLGHCCTDARLLVGGTPTQARRGDGATPGQQPTQVEGALLAALQADHDEASVGGQRCDVGLEVLGPDDVEDHVHPLAFGGRQHLVRPVVVVVDGDVCAELAAEVELVGRPGRGEDASPDGLGVLDGEGADAAGAAVDQDRLTLAEVHVVEVREDGGRHLDQPGCADQVHPGRWRDNLTGRHAHQFGVATAGEQGDALVAGAPAGDVVPYRFDDAGDLQADHVADAGRGRIVALALQQVGAVDPGCPDADDHLAPRGHGPGSVAEGQVLGPAGGGDGDNAHGFSLSRRPSVR